MRFQSQRPTGRLFPGRRRPLASERRGFSPVSLFANGEQGVIYDPNDLSTLFQDSAGATPVTAAWQPVGLMLDKRMGLVRGPEKADNTDFTDPSKFQLSGGAVITAGALVFSSAPSSASARVLPMTAGSGNVVPGRFYEVVLTVKDYVSGSVAINLNGLAYSRAGFNGTHTFIAAAGAGSGFFDVTGFAGTATYSVDSVSVRELPGNHVYQTSAAARPFYNGSPSRASFDGADDAIATATFAAGTLGADMDCFIALKLNRNPFDAAIISNGANVPYLLAVGGSNVVSSGSGSPTFAVDGVSVSASSRLQLNAALGVGEWHIVEARNANLSSWTQFGVIAWSTYTTSAEVGGVILCPAQNAETRTKIRQYLATKVGVTLP